jgi:cation diffusion facilitator CzcD-associated flavoprotein CzcO
MKVIERVARAHREQQVTDPELRRKVTPGYAMGCKRILPSNRWYPALQEPNVELVTGGVREVRRNSVVGEDGVEREVDAIVFGTGFQVTDMPAAKLIAGRDGERLSEVWAGSPRSHRGATVPGFPNLFMLLGPNTGLGHNSIVYMIESQIAYVLDALRVMDERGASVAEVRPDTAEAWNAGLDERLEGTVWTTGCMSWYQDATGRNGAIWPDWTWRFRRETARFDEDGYDLRVPSPVPSRVPVAA